MKYTIKSLVGRVVAFLLTLVMLLTGGITSVLAESTPAEADTTPSAETAAEATTAPTDEAAPQAEADTQTATEAAQAATADTAADSTTDAAADASDIAESPAVTINDAALRQAICAALGKDYSDDVVITEAEMQSLTTLTAENAGITNLAGLQYATNLESLDLSGNAFTSLPIVQLRQLTQLKNVDLSNNQIAGTIVFQAMPALETMNLANNRINAINFNSNRFENLVNMDLSGNYFYQNEGTTGYSDMVEMGIDKFNLSEQRNLADLEGIYLKGVTETSFNVSFFGRDKIYADDTISVIDVGDYMGSTMTFACIGYTPDATTKVTVNDAIYTVVSTSKTGSLEEGAIPIRVSNLQPGENTITLSVMHMGGDTREYTLKVNAQTVPNEGENSAGIEDPSLQQAVCDALGIEDFNTHVVTQEEMASLTGRLNLYNVTSLEGIQYATGLNRITVNSGTFDNIPEFGDSVTNVTLTSENCTTVPAWLSEKTALTSLTLNMPKMQELQDLSALPLTSLSITSDALKELPNLPTTLTTLNLANLTIKNLPENLKDCDALTNLTLDNCSMLTDYSALKDMADGQLTLEISNYTGGPILSGLADNNGKIRVLDTLRISYSSGFTFDDSISGMPNLRVINIQNSNLKTLPDWIAESTGLTSAVLSNNALTDMPSALTQMPSMTTLNLSYNPISQISQDLSGLSSLSTLNLYSCGLETLPDSINQLSSLTSLDLRMNNLRNIDTAISGLTQLTTLQLSSNYLAAVPKTINTLTNLATLDMTSNPLTTIDYAAFEGLANLKTVRLSGLIMTDTASQDAQTQEAISQLRAQGVSVSVAAPGPTALLQSLSAEGYGEIGDVNSPIKDGSSGTAVVQLNMQVEEGTTEVTLNAVPYYDDTTLTVNGESVDLTQPIVINELSDGPNTVTLVTNNPRQPNGSVTYHLTIMVGAYAQDFPQEGHTYQIPVTALKEIENTNSMTNTYIEPTVRVTYRDGQYLVDFTCIRQDYMPSLTYRNSEGIYVDADELSRDISANTAVWRMTLENIDDYIYISPYVVPMGYSPVCRLQLNLEQIVDITDQMPTVDKSALNIAINAADAIVAGNNVYTDASWQALTDALATAKDTVAFDLATQTAIDTAAANLNAAIEGLVVDDSKVADKTALQTALDTAAGLEKGTHTDTAWNTLQDAITAAQAVYDDVTATQAAVDAQTQTLNMAITLFNASGDASELDKNNLADGVYSVYVDMKNASNPSQASMADGAIDHTVKLEVIDGKYYITLDFKGMTINLLGQNFFGYLKELSYYADGYSIGMGVTGDLLPAEVLSTQKNADGTDVVDSYNDADGDGTADYLYPDQVRFELVPTAIQDNNGYAALQVFVPIMDAISAGSGTQNVFMQIDWSTLKAEDPTPDIDEAAVQAVVDAIDGLGAITSLDQEEQVATVRAAYDLLNADEKALVTNLSVLEAAEATIAELKAQAEQEAADKAAAQAVADLIAALPAADSLTLDDKADVEAARAAYNALTDSQKAYVAEDTLATLTNAEAKIAELTAAQEQADKDAAAAVDAQIAALPTIDSLTLSDKASVEEARAAYNRLTDTQKGYVTGLATLEAAEARIAELVQAATDAEVAQTVTDQIAALPAVDALTTDDAAKVQAARDAYNKLTDRQKALVSDESLKTLEAAEAKMAELVQAETDAKAAQAVTDQIAALPAVDALTVNDAAKVQAARDAYEALTDSQKELVSEESVKALEAAEAKMAELTADVPSAGLGGNTLPGGSNLPATTGGINGDTLGKGSNVNTGVANDTANTAAAVGLIAAAGVGAALYSRRRKGSDA